MSSFQDDALFKGDVDNNFKEGGSYRDSPEFDKLKEEIVAQLFEINGQISTLQHFISTLKNFLDKKNDMNAKVIDNIDKKAVKNIEKIGNLVKKINEEILRLDNIEVNDLDKLQLIERDKLTRDLRYSLEEFQNTQRQYTVIIKSINDKAKLNLKQQNLEALRQDEEGIEMTSTVASKKNIVIQREALNNEELAYQHDLIRQRNEEILNIERGITELNEVFSDLGNVIQQQGVLVDNIEANIYTTVNHTAMASRELDKAMRSQRKLSKWCLYLLMILSGMLFFMMLIILI